MKKEYIKPTLLVIKTEPSQIMATSPGSEGDGLGGNVNLGGDGDDDNYEIDEGEDGEGLPPAAKGGLWDEYTW